MLGRVSILSLATVFLASGLPQYSAALPIAPLGSAQVGGVGDVIQVANPKNNKPVAKAKVKNQAHPHAKPVAKAKVGKQVHVKKVHPATTKHVVVKKTVVVYRPYRAWRARPYYGVLIGGVALGSIILVSSPRVVPVAPADNMCWFWADQNQMRGYWDYCNPPF
jgi:hypothetical protein